MTITARILYFMAFWTYIAFAVAIGYVHDRYITLNGPLNGFAFTIVIILIIASFATAIVCMIQSVRD